MTGLEILLTIVLGFFLLIVPLVIAFVLNKSRSETKLILGVYFLCAAVVMVGVLTLLGLM